jgi:hypothetical protein
MRGVTAAPTGATALPTDPHSSPSSTIADPYSGYTAANPSPAPPLASRASSISACSLSPRSAEIPTLSSRPRPNARSSRTHSHKTTCLPASCTNSPLTLAQTCLTPTYTNCPTCNSDEAPTGHRGFPQSNLKPQLLPLTATPNVDHAIAAEE